MTYKNSNKVNSYPHFLIVDGLRAIAIIVIVWLHIWQQSWWSNNIYILNHRIYVDLIPRTGFLGVELFLFISGFGLFYSFQKRLMEEGKPEDLKIFFKKRILRIVPSYLLSIILLLVITHPFNSLNEALPSVLNHFLFVHNLFPETFGTISGVLWVIGVEAQFYLIFPILARIFVKKPLLTFLILNLLAMGYRRYMEIHQLSNIGFYINQVPGFLDLYADGMLCSYLLSTVGNNFATSTIKKSLSTLILVSSVILLFYLMNNVDSLPYVLNGSTVWQASNRHILGLVFLSLTFFSAFSFSIWKKLLSNRLMVFLSTISFNLFLWHQIIALQLKKYSIPPFSGLDPHNDSHWQIQYTIITVALSLLVATILTYGFEIPIRKLGFKGYLNKIIRFRNS